MSNNWIETIPAIVKDHRLKARMKVVTIEAPSDWGWIISPVPLHLETGDFGPYPERDVEWVEIDMNRIEYRGKLISTVSIDASDEVIKALSNLRYTKYEKTNIIRVLPGVA